MDHSLTMFLLLCFLLTITPGADTALILNTALRSNPRGILMTTLGVCAGLLFHATMSALGLSVILQQSARAYSIIQGLGALYLIYLGARSLHDAFRSSEARAESAGKPPLRPAAAFRQGALTNALNPKVAVFYLTFLPQFMDPSRGLLLQSLGLASIHIAMSFAWLYSVGRFVGYFRDFLSKPRIRRRLEALSGLALLGFGARLALSRS
jgi:threonine/homoserine/homoserine lactone efflux protein